MNHSNFNPSAVDENALRPELLPTFVEFGFTPLANRIPRESLAGNIRIKAAARRWDVNLQRLLNALNAARRLSTDATAATGYVARAV